ncbi:LacI family transcriptional regulator [Lachnospiraceae bacterium PF1-21]|uniref:LacI family DNA-binding transcriptional regulator n=1 Tax=Ohessyouella blattaphilus TaxID=2949333 RepID=UPI003E24FF5A
MGITIKEIAQLAGVHRSTVDKVIHNREGVSDAVRKKIKKIIEENNYQANPIGKALKMQDKTLNIKVILMKVDALSYLMKGIESMMKNYGSFNINLDYEILDFANVNLLKEMIISAIDEEYDGLIISPLNTAEIVEAIDYGSQKGIPIVTVNSDVKGSERLSFVGQNGYKAGKVAGRFMGEFLKGTGKVAILTSDSDEHQSFPFGTREGGFRDTLSHSYQDIELLPSIRTYENSTITHRKTAKLLSEIPDLKGLFITCGCVKDACEALLESNLTNIKLICFEEYPEILEMLDKDVITMTIASGLVEQGEIALKTLLDKLIYEISPPKKHLYTDIHILVKESL